MGWEQAKVATQVKSSPILIAICEPARQVYCANATRHNPDYAKRSIGFFFSFCLSPSALLLSYRSYRQRRSLVA